MREGHDSWTTCSYIISLQSSHLQHCKNYSIFLSFVLSKWLVHTLSIYSCHTTWWQQLIIYVGRFYRILLPIHCLMYHTVCNTNYENTMRPFYGNHKCHDTPQNIFHTVGCLSQSSVCISFHLKQRASSCSLYAQRSVRDKDVF